MTQRRDGLRASSSSPLGGESGYNSGSLGCGQRWGNLPLLTRHPHRRRVNCVRVLSTIGSTWGANTANFALLSRSCSTLRRLFRCFRRLSPSFGTQSGHSGGVGKDRQQPWGLSLRVLLATVNRWVMHSSQVGIAVASGRSCRSSHPSTTCRV